jgi:hypothetical protein
VVVAGTGRTHRLGVAAGAPRTARIGLSAAACAAAAALGLALADRPSEATARARAATPPELRTALRPGQQLAAMRAGIRAAASLFGGTRSGCARTTVVLAHEGSGVMAGNFRDEASGCYVWLNLAHSPLLNAQEICKLALHETGHLHGLRHAGEPDDVMYSPFRAAPIPPECARPFGAPQPDRRTS